MRVLLIAPEPMGHPQLYCRVLTAELRKLGWDVFIATGDHKGTFDPRRYPDLDVLGRAGLCSFLDVGPFEAVLQDRVVRNIQRKCGADATIFIEGDKFRTTFLRIAAGVAKPFYGRTAAIFARTSAWYPGEDFYTGEKLRRRTLREIATDIRSRLKGQGATDRYFFETALMRRRTVDAVLVKDERIAQAFSSPVHWLPEMFRPFDDIETDEGCSQYAEVTEGYDRFRRESSAVAPVLYFGEGTWYRGYDQFLRLVADTPEAFGIHLGNGFRVSPGKPYQVDVDAVRACLIKERRLYEMGAFVLSQRLVDHFHGLITYGVSTHRLVGSSGTVLQALFSGKPVIVPDSGLLGFHARSFNLGYTYRYSDVDHLRSVWNGAVGAPTAMYDASIRRFMERYKPPRLQEVMKTVLGAL